jgi:hypothetical protein
MAKVSYYVCPVGHRLAPTTEAWSTVVLYHCEKCGKAYSKLAQLVTQLITI